MIVCTVRYLVIPSTYLCVYTVHEKHYRRVCLFARVCAQTKGALAAAAAASAVAAQVARGRGRAALARGAFVSAAAPGYVTPGNHSIQYICPVYSNGFFCYHSPKHAKWLIVQTK